MIDILTACLAVAIFATGYSVGAWRADVQARGDADPAESEAKQ